MVGGQLFGIGGGGGGGKTRQTTDKKHVHVTYMRERAPTKLFQVSKWHICTYTQWRIQICEKGGPGIQILDSAPENRPK